MADLQPTLATLLGGDVAQRDLPMRLVRKHGRPFLLLPANSQLAAQTLALYPAQTFRARVARQGLRTALAAGLSVGTEKISLPVSAANAFVRFLSNAVGGANDTIPNFGVLAGNPSAAGQRFVFLVFDANGTPRAVVKAGLTEEARKLIRREKDFLTSAPVISGIPRLRAAMESPPVEALAMDFVEGVSPRERDERQLPQLLTSWIRPGAPVPLSETRVWSELQPHCSALPFFTELTKELKERTVSPVVFHGDLAPWNIKVSTSGAWSVFDWERGDLNGMPGYDWFHYLIQTRILVAHEPTPVLVMRLEPLFSSEAFQKYAALTRITGIERLLAIVYLLHHNEVIRPGEGLNEGQELLRILMGRHAASRKAGNQQRL
jgi:hypothetical protein